MSTTRFIIQSALVVFVAVILVGEIQTALNSLEVYNPVAFYACVFALGAGSCKLINSFD